MYIRITNNMVDRWIEEAKWLYDIRELPLHRIRKCRACGHDLMRTSGARKAKRRIFEIVGKSAEKAYLESNDVWNAIVKAPEGIES